MLTQAIFDRQSRFLGIASGLVGTIALYFALSGMTAGAQSRERSGKEVVDAVCASCHAKGANGAPKIGDQKAWAERASHGLTVLTKHALTGIRNMPAHGGSPGVSDIEIERAIIYMVNRSGGHWIEPAGGGTTAVARDGEQIVQMQCSKCHQTGLNGAPKIGDRAAWMPRLKNGLDALVASAIHGHGPMPARGGVADLSAAEIRGAIVYMFNYGVPLSQAAPAPTRAADPYHKVVGGTEIYLGMMPAKAIRAAQAAGKPLSGMHGGIPSGNGYYHLNISLADSKTKAPITDAEVKVKVADAIGEESRTLHLIAANNAISYGDYFRMLSGNVYGVTAQIRRRGIPGVIEASFEFKAP